jgi:hypothetical protein
LEISQNGCFIMEHPIKMDDLGFWLRKHDKTWDVHQESWGESNWEILGERNPRNGYST